MPSVSVRLGLQFWYWKRRIQMSGRSCSVALADAIEKHNGRVRVDETTAEIHLNQEVHNDRSGR